MKKIITLSFLLLALGVSAKSNVSSMSISDFAKNSNIIGADKMFGFTIGGSSDFVNVNSSSIKLIGSFGYQVFQNIWTELSVGFSKAANYPGEGIDTILYSYALKAKVALAGPWKSIVMPYMGIQLNSPYSPGAGQGVSSYQGEVELAAVDSLKEVKPVFGFTVIRPFAKGWHARVDLGGDVVAAGVTATF